MSAVGLDQLCTLDPLSVLASEICTKLVGFFECESADAYRAPTVVSRVHMFRFKNIGKLESGYNQHTCDCNYLWLQLGKLVKNKQLMS